MSPIESLPQELVDRIVDEFQSFPVDDELYQTLLVCKLVCKSFSARARQLLLAVIKIADGPSTLKVASLCSSLKANPGLSHHIRSLSLSFHAGDARQIQELLNIMKDQRVNLEHLGIRCDHEDLVEPLRFTSIIEGLRESFYQISSLTTLHLKFIAIPIVSVARFQNLNTLVIERCSFPPGASSLDYDGLLGPGAFANLEALHITRCVESFKERLLTLGFRFRKLKTLYCLFREWNDMHHISVLLTNCGAGVALENLELVEESLLYVFQPMRPGLLDLSKLESLRHFKLKSVMGHPYGTFVGTTVSRLLNSAALSGPTTIQTINVALDTTFPLRLPLFLRDNDNWKSLDLDLVDGLRYPSLRTANFSLHLRPGKGKILTVEEAKRLLEPELQFPTLRNSPLIALKVAFTIEPSLFT